VNDPSTNWEILNGFYEVTVRVVGNALVLVLLPMLKPVNVYSVRSIEILRTKLRPVEKIPESMRQHDIRIHL
jgi:hypothetical protein